MSLLNFHAGPPMTQNAKRKHIFCFFGICVLRSKFCVFVFCVCFAFGPPGAQKPFAFGPHGAQKAFALVLIEVIASKIHNK